ncbi:MAG: hypothetical protein ACNA7Q_12315 [Rhodobacterales bacterium]
MARKFIASVLVAAVAITGFSVAPARADIRDLAQAAAGIAAVAIIANQLNKSRDRSQESLSSRNHLGVFGTPHYSKPQHKQFQQGYGGHQVIQPRPLPNRVARRALPAACVMTLSDQRGRPVSVLGERCLQKNYRDARNLPGACSVDIRGQRNWSRAYDATCLSRAGYTIARR